MSNLTVKDLRVGNYYDLLGHLYQLDEKGLENILMFDKIERLNPVPLTPKILEKAGGLGNVGLLSTGSNYSKTVNYWIDNGEGQIIGEEIKHLHELQNYYYAVHRKELTINLNQLQQAL